jgi:hypothetical protein
MRSSLLLSNVRRLSTPAPTPCPNSCRQFWHRVEHREYSVWVPTSINLKTKSIARPPHPTQIIIAHLSCLPTATLLYSSLLLGLLLESQNILSAKMAVNRRHYYYGDSSSNDYPRGILRVNRAPETFSNHPFLHSFIPSFIHSFIHALGHF